MVHSKRKGNRAELHVAKKLEEWWGTPFVRTPGSGGFATVNKSVDLNLVGDVVTDDPTFPFSVEVKNAENWKLSQLLTSDKAPLWEYWEQTVEQASRETRIPLLVFTKNYQPYWVMTLFLLGDFGSLSFVAPDRVVKLCLFDDFLSIPKDSWKGAREKYAQTKKI